MIKTWLDIAPEYLNFMLRFLRNPRHAFAGVSGTAKVSSDLTSILLGGVAFSYLIVMATASPDLKADPSKIVELLRQLDYRLLPVLTMMATVAIAVVSHLLGKLLSIVSRLSWRASSNRWDPKLGGGVEDSVNAALGFAAVYIPLVAAALCGVSWVPGDKTVSAGVVGALLSVFAVVYFPWALSSTHPDTGFLHAFLAFSGAVVLAAFPMTLWGP